MSIFFCDIQTHKTRNYSFENGIQHIPQTFHLAWKQHGDVKMKTPWQLQQ